METRECTLETCGGALKTHEPSYMPRPANLFIIPKAEGHGTCGSAGALLSREVGSRVTGHMAAPEPSQAGRRVLEL
jgi:hypothetical protein